MWNWLLLTVLLAANLKGISSKAVVEDDEAGRNHHKSLRYVFDNLFQRYMQSEEAGRDHHHHRSLRYVFDKNRSMSKRRASQIPVITSTDDDFTVEKGKDVTLPCEVNNIGRSYVIWKKDETVIIKVKKLGNPGSRWNIPRRYRTQHIDTGDMSLEETSLTLHNIDMDDQGTYSCTVDGEDTQVEHTLSIQDLNSVVTTAVPSDDEDDYYDEDYYENYEDLVVKDDEDEPENKVDKVEEKSSSPSTEVEEEIKEEHLKETSNENESDDYYDYYEDLYDSSSTEETRIEDPEEIETRVEIPEHIETTTLPQVFKTETTTETPIQVTTTETPTPEPTEPARTWSFWGSKPKESVQVTTTETPTSEPTESARTWSFWGSKPKESVKVTTTETPTTTERVKENEDDEYSYGYDDDYDYGDDKDKEDIENEENDIEIDDKDHDEENAIDDDYDYGDDEDKEDIENKENDIEIDDKDHDEENVIDDEQDITTEALQVSVGKDGMACLACTLPLSDDDEQEHVEWRFNNVSFTPDGKSIVALKDGDMDTILLTSVQREDLGEYMCIVGEREAVFHLVAFPTKPIYKMVDKNSDGNYQITWEAKGLVSIDSYSITYRERNSESEWWQQEGPFEVSLSPDDTYSHTFHNLQPYTDYEAIVSTIYQDMATTGDPFPFSVKRTGDMYPSSRKPGNGLAKAWMKQSIDTSKTQALELVCMMDIKRRTKVQWFHGHDKDPVKADERITSYQKGKKNLLKFESVEPSDLGEYRCQGQTPSGIKEATVQLVAFPPPANNQEITEISSGTYKLTWDSKGLAPVTSFSITYRKSDSTSEGWHQIGPIQVKDSGSTDDKYSYEFTNLQPSSSYDVIVSTIYRDLATTGEPFSFTTKDDESSSVIASINQADVNIIDNVRVWIEQPVVQVDIGKSAELVCLVDEKQDMQIEWYHGHQKIAIDNQRFIRTEDNKSILEFTSISTEDLGTYQCIAYNKFGRTNAFAQLTTAQDISITPPRGVLKSEDVTQWWSLTQAIFSDVHKYLKTFTRIPQPTELVY